MKLLMLVFAFLIVLAAGVGISQNASAHVVVNSTDSDSSAIMHIIPDDDPIAGEVANLMFDTQDGFLKDNSEISLVIMDLSKQSEVTVPTRRDDSLVLADYTFPTQGAYMLKYTVVTEGRAQVFEQDMRVSRGIQGTGQVVQKYPWAEGLLFAVAVLFLVIVVIGWNKRHEIFAFSKL